MIHIDYNHKRQKGVISGDYFDVIREYFSVENPAARFLRNKHFIPKRLYAITPTGQFDVCMTPEIIKYLHDRGIDADIKITAEAQQIISPSVTHPIATNLKLELRDYQLQSLELCMQQGRGIAVLGTGAGKTLVCASLIESFYRASNPEMFKCLMIVPDLTLVNQTYNDFVQYGVSFTLTRWTGSLDPDMSSNLIIANTAILQSRFESNDWIQFVDLLIIDETHKAGKGTELSKIIQQITTPHKFGFTGTLPEDKISRWSIIGKIGPILIEKSSHALRAEHHLTNVDVKVLQVCYNPITVDTTSNYLNEYRRELEFIYANDFRNKLIKTVCNNFNNNVLVLVNHIEHGELLTHVLQSLEDRQVFFIRGEVEVDERDKVKQIMESSSNVVCIAISSIFSTGVNIKNIHMIVFAAGGKSFIRTVQSIGRGLRLHPSKNKLTIIDIADELEYGKKHSNKRCEIYNQEKISFTKHKVLEK